jgi:hypothetical protein
MQCPGWCWDGGDGRTGLMATEVTGPCHTLFSKENQVHTYMHARIKFHAYSDI